MFNYEVLNKFLLNVWNTTEALGFWLLIGLLIAGLIHVFVPDNFIVKHLGHKRGILAVFKAVVLGVPMPLCSCGVIPAALGIKKQGAGDGAAMGFLISTPQTGVDSIMVSASLLGFPFALFKLASAFIIGLLGGIIAYFWGRDDVSSEQCDDKLNVPKRTLVDIFSFAVDDILKGIWRWLVFGIFISAALTTFLPENFFHNYLPENIFIAMFLVLLISLPMYVCATASVPIAAALVYAGMPSGAALVFLMAGPATNIATVGAVFRAFGLRLLLVYLGTIILGSMLGGYLFESVIKLEAAKQSLTPDAGKGLVTIIAGIILGLLILRFILIDLYNKYLNFKRGLQKKTMQEELYQESFLVEGMTCEGCVAHLKQDLLKVSGVLEVEIKLDGGAVDVTGKDFNKADLESTIISAGYSIV
jgi:uncharacterized membrane protein YraQ (UPF0718 family)/copper chaperone CopZ